MFEPFSKMSSQKWAHVGLLAGFCLLLYFVNLGQWDLWNPDEPRYAQVTREMVTGGDWVLMHFNGNVYPDKPPLFFWLVALASLVWQGFGSFAVRLPAAVFGTLTVLLTYLLGRELYSPRVAFLSALILATSVQFAYLSMRANIDTTLAFFTTASLACFWMWHRGREGERHPWVILGFYVGMALATLTKGPVGFIFPVLVCLTYLVIRKDWRAVRAMKLPFGLALLVAMVLVWYVPALARGGEDYFSATFFKHTIARYAEGWSHPQPVYYYLYNFPFNFLPWTFFLPAAIAHGITKEMAGKRQEFLFLLIWCIVIFLFFSFARGKRGLYLIPLFPASALMVGKVWEDLLEGRCRLGSKWISFPTYGLTALLVILGLITPLGVHRLFPSFLLYSLPVAFLLVTVGTACFLLYRSGRQGMLFALLVGMMTAGILYTSGVIFPLANPYKSARFISQEITRHMNPGDKLGIFGEGTGPYNFYTGIVPIVEFRAEDEVLYFLRSPERVLCLFTTRDLDHLRETGKIPPVRTIIHRQVGSNSIVVVTNR